MLTLEQMINGKTDAQCIVDVMTQQPKAIIHDTSLELFDAMIDQWYGLPEVKRNTPGDNVIYLDKYR